MLFCFLLGAYISTATFGIFTATHGCKFSTAIHILKLPHLRKVAVTAAIWQPWVQGADE
jgi:hypothetical protein